MSNLNIPLYRAEVKDSKFHREDIEFFTELIDGKRYAIGLLCTKGRQIEVTKGDTTTFINIDNSTLAIHFPSMIDGKGNKIFASLSENRKGGDILESKWFNIDSCLTVKTEAAKWSKSGFCFTQDGYSIARYEYKKTIGIQK